jgi:hypothetical protein
MLDGTEFFECSCGSDEHTLRFILSFDEDEPSIYTTVFLGAYPLGWKRLWTAIRYLFGYKCKYGHWDCFELRQEDAERMQFMLQRLINVIATRQERKVQADAKAAT